MALRQAISKFLLPNLEQDLQRSVRTELATVAHMTDTMLAPHVYAYESASTSQQGAFHGTGSRMAPAEQQQMFVKVEYATPGRGLFQ